MSTDMADPEALSSEEGEAMSLLVQAEALAILGPHEVAFAVAMRRTAKEFIERVLAKYQPAKREKDAEKRVLLDAEKAELALPQRLLAVVNDKLGAYEQARRLEQLMLEARAAQEAQATGALVPAPPPTRPKVEGLAFVAQYEVHVYDPHALAAAVAAGTLPPDAIVANLAVLREVAKRAAQASAARPVRLPGCTVVERLGPRGV